MWSCMPVILAIPKAEAGGSFMASLGYIGRPYLIKQIKQKPTVRNLSLYGRMRILDGEERDVGDLDKATEAHVHPGSKIKRPRTNLLSSVALTQPRAAVSMVAA